MSAKTCLLAAAVLLGSVVLLSGLTATEANGPEVLRACYVPNTGVVYRIGVSDTPEECKSHRHVEFSWTDGEGADHGALSGLGDDDHPQYLMASEVPSPWAGYEIVAGVTEQPISGPADRVLLGARARCPSGKVVINGGHSFDPADPRVLVESVPVSAPDADLQAWHTQVRVSTPLATATFVEIAAFAICVTAPPGL